MSRPELVRCLLLAGVAAGIVFILVSAVESYARPGFDLNRHAVSMLSLGDRGWVMVWTFIVSGLLTVLSAVGLGLTGGGLAGPLLIGVYGAGLIIAGIFPTPPAFGFPPGTPNDLTPVMDTNAKLHGAGFMIAFSALIIACFVYARAFYQSGFGGWTAVSIAAGLAMPVLVASGMSNVIAPGIAFLAAAIIGWVWLGAVAVSLLP